MWSKIVRRLTRKKQVRRYQEESHQASLRMQEHARQTIRDRLRAVEIKVMNETRSK